jgi:hypothetical protein
MYRLHHVKVFVGDGTLASHSVPNQKWLLIRGAMHCYLNEHITIMCDR